MEPRGVHVEVAVLSLLLVGLCGAVAVAVVAVNIIRTNTVEEVEIVGGAAVAAAALFEFPLEVALLMT